MIPRLPRAASRPVLALALALAILSPWAPPASGAQATAPAAAIPRPEHPDPTAVRPHWANLNGPWQFRFDAGDEGLKAEWFAPDAAGFDQTIAVPFPWESALAGLRTPADAAKGVTPQIGWYRRTVRVPDAFPADDRVWLRFGAVDWRADVWINGTKVAEHEGGYSPFEVDATDALKRGEDNTVVVRAFDPTDPSLPTGKQVGWYTPSSGIWQTVWLESRPKARIEAFGSATLSLEPAVVKVNLLVRPAEKGEYTVSLTGEAPEIGARSATFATGEDNAAPTVHTFMFPVQNAKLWSPESPHLYDVTLELKSPSGAVDSIRTYLGLRTIARGKVGDEPFERVLLNGKPIYLRGALDQSFNPEGLYTAPSDEFLKQDIELARTMGTNFLRIHIKPEEPRRLYWADKLGMLIMEDMPNTWRQNERARAAWEATMREILPRDRNHPSIFSWVAFNETWGLGTPEEYKANKGTQQWVKDMVALMRQIDPTRLIEDNSPCNYDHVAGTDLNSWHFYIDNHDEAKRHIDGVVAGSTPGSAFNYCPGETMNSAPLINSEYGSVSAGSGDRDISWGFRDLTTLLRKQPKIQGYIYTELTDIEWEHNGFANYDRTPKTFGYDAFVPGMTPADLQGADFIGYDGPPAIEAKVGELIPVELFVSHYSTLTEAPVLKWWVTGVNGEGEKIGIEPRTREVQWAPYSVTPQKRVAFKLGEPFVGAVALVLEDRTGKRLAANFVNVVVRPEAPAPRIERIDDHTVALRFAPGEFSSARWSDGFSLPDGKAHGRGNGSFVYKLKVPEAVVKAKPKAFRIRAELAAKAGREKVDWALRRNAQDYPQTDVRKHPSGVLITLNGRRVAGVALADDPADARGVLSHLKGQEHGSFGYLIDAAHPLPDTAIADLAAGSPLILRLGTSDDSGPHGGLAVYGAETGAYPIEPTLFLETEADLPADLGVDAGLSPAVETMASRRVGVLPSGEAGRDQATTWAYTTDEPEVGAWIEPGFDDSAWKRGPAGFGTEGTPAVAVHTPWNTPTIWLRTTIDVPELGDNDLLMLRLFHDEDVDLYVNGKRVYVGPGYITAYEDVVLDGRARAAFKPGPNQIAVRCRQTGGGQGIDLGLTVLKGD